MENTISFYFKVDSQEAFRKHSDKFSLKSAPEKEAAFSALGELTESFLEPESVDFSPKKRFLKVRFLSGSGFEKTTRYRSFLMKVTLYTKKAQTITV